MTPLAEEPSKRAILEQPEVIEFQRAWVVDAHEVLRECAARLSGGEKGRLIAVADVMQMKLTLPESRIDYVTLQGKESDSNRCPEAPWVTIIQPKEE